MKVFTPEGSVNTSPNTMRPRQGRRAARYVAALAVLPLISASHCDGRPHPGTSSGEQQMEKERQGPSVSQLPAGGTPCGGLNTVRTEFDCGNGISGSYSESFGSGHYHIDHNGQRVDGGDPSIPVYETIDVNGMCVIISHTNEDELAAIQLYQHPC